MVNKINIIRTIAKDDYTTTNYSDMVIMAERIRRQNVLGALGGLVERFTREIAEEKSNPNPNMEYINARLAKIKEIRGTLESAQKVAQR